MARVLVTGNVVLGGFDRCSTRIANTLQALKAHQVDVMVMRAPEQSHQEVRGQTRFLRVSPSSTDLSQHIELLARALRRQWEGEEYDVVHCVDTDSAVEIAALRRESASDSKLIIDLGGASLMKSQVLAESTTTPNVWQQADQIIVASESQRQWCPRDHDVSVVPLGVDINAFDWEFSQPTEVPMIALVTDAEQSRSVEQMLHAVALLRQQAIPVQLSVMAHLVSPLLEHLQNVTRFLNLTSHVHWRGPIAHEQLPRAISESTICVALANDKGEMSGCTPTKVLEYWACRRPVLAVSPLHDVIADGHAAMSTSPQPMHIANALKALLASTELQERFADVGYDLVRRHHNAAVARRAMQQVYRHL
jgi:glycosyltransferase involved in cell wall biosynthesis